MTDRETNLPADNTFDEASRGQTSHDESQSVSEATVSPSHPNIVAYHTQLTGLCRDMLRTIHALNRSETVATGVHIEARMEAEYGYEIGDVHDRLQFLDENEYISKQYLNGRTKRYLITQCGQRSLRALALVTVADLEPLLDEDLNCDLMPD